MLIAEKGQDGERCQWTLFDQKENIVKFFTWYSQLFLMKCLSILQTDCKLYMVLFKTKGYDFFLIAQIFYSNVQEMCYFFTAIIKW